MEDVGGGKRKEKKIIKVDVEIMNKNLRGERIDLLFFFLTNDNQRGDSK